MDKKNIVAKVLYVLAIVSFFGYLITKRSSLMAIGGILLTVGGIMVIISKKKK